MIQLLWFWVHSLTLLPFIRSYCAVNIVQKIEALDMLLPLEQ